MEVEQMLKAAMSNSGFESYGNVNWMAGIVISDVEEFVVNPFGPINANSTPKGIYSEYGHIMINNGSDVQHSYEGSLQKLVEYICSDTPDTYLNMMGYKKVGGLVLNLVNERPFSETDAEHFLCKGWLIAKLTFGHYRNSKYPLQSKSFTHPSPTLHSLPDMVIEKTMHVMETTFLSGLQSHSIQACQLPEFCRLPGEEVSTQPREEESVLDHGEIVEDI
jgi:hypothetical protein